MFVCAGYTGYRPSMLPERPARPRSCLGGGRRPSTVPPLYGIDPTSLSVSTTLTSLAASTPGTPGGGQQMATEKGFPGMLNGPRMTVQPDVRGATGPAVITAAGHPPFSQSDRPPSALQHGGQNRCNMTASGQSYSREPFPDPAPVHGAQDFQPQHQQQSTERENFQVR